jgi:hypothetical protein
VDGKIATDQVICAEGPFPCVGGRRPDEVSRSIHILGCSGTGIGESGSSIGGAADVAPQVVPEAGRPGCEIPIRHPLLAATPMPPSNRRMPLLDAARRDTP